jgi:hypothetical protein
MLEAVKPVLLEKVDIISSQFTNSVSSLQLLNHATVTVTLPVVYPTQLLHCLY